LEQIYQDELRRQAAQGSPDEKKVHYIDGEILLPIFLIVCIWTILGLIWVLVYGWREQKLVTVLVLI
jgi:hypothetical protein